MPIALILGVMVVLVIIAGVVLLQGSGGDVVDERLDQLSEFTAEWVPAADSAGEQQRRSAREAVAERLDAVMSRRGFGEGMRAQLRKADLKLTVAEYLLLHLVTFVLAGLVGYVIFSSPDRPQVSLFLAAVSAFAGLFVPRIWVGMQRNRRLNQFNQQLSDVLNLWVNSLRAGYSVMQSLEAIAGEAPDPSSTEFKRVVQEVQLGIPVETSLDHMLERMESDDLDMVFTAVNIQREVGGNLAEILDVISHTIRERVRIQGEIRTLTAQGRLTGYILSGLPIILALFLYAINPDYMGRLFSGPPFIGGSQVPCGFVIITIGLIMIAIGSAVIRRIVDIEV